MRFWSYIPLLAFAVLELCSAQEAVNTAATSTATSASTAYQAPDPKAGYVTPDGYSYGNGYNPVYGVNYPGTGPSGTSGGSGYPAGSHSRPSVYSAPAAGSAYGGPTGYSDYSNMMVPSAQGALRVALRFFANVGLFLMGGLVLLLVGGLFTTAVCSLTPLCTISIAGVGDFGKSDSMRSLGALMSPEKLTSAAALVNDAIGKYQRLQRSLK